MISGLQKQPTAFSCLATVAAMIACEHVADVLEQLSHDGSSRPFAFLEIAAWLNSRGFHLGAFADAPDSGRFRLVTASFKRNGSALLIVSRKHEKGSHAVYWNGLNVLDPAGVRGKLLNDYQVLEWWPVIRFEG